MGEALYTRSLHNHVYNIPPTDLLSPRAKSTYFGGGIVSLGGESFTRSPHTWVQCPPHFHTVPHRPSYFNKITYFGGGIVILGVGSYTRPPHNLRYNAPPIVLLSPQSQFALLGEALSFWGWDHSQGHLITLCTVPPPFSYCPPRANLPSWGRHCHFGGGIVHKVIL